MDVSLNTIDLEYLINPAFANLRVKTEEDDTLKTDIEFYRKRIFKLTKDLLRNTTITTEVDRGFNEYAKICIKYFKFLDKSDIIQKQYLEKKKKASKGLPKHEQIPNHLLMRETPANNLTIPECMPVNVKNEKKKTLGMKKEKDEYQSGVQHTSKTTTNNIKQSVIQFLILVTNF